MSAEARGARLAASDGPVGGTSRARHQGAQATIFPGRYALADIPGGLALGDFRDDTLFALRAAVEPSSSVGTLGLFEGAAPDAGVAGDTVVDGLSAKSRIRATLRPAAAGAIPARARVRFTDRAGLVRVAAP